MKIDHLDHLVLTVKSIAQTCSFYEQILGMQKVEFAENRVALKFGQYKINLHELGHEFEPKARQACAGSADLCLITASTISDVKAHLISHAIIIEQGPVQRSGANGPINSIYIRDPDENLIEIATYNIS